MHTGPRTSVSSLCMLPATPELYTLSLHDALPIYDDETSEGERDGRRAEDHERGRRERDGRRRRRRGPDRGRSEEHTSELQSRLHLVCRLLLEKKKHTHSSHHHAK